MRRSSCSACRFCGRHKVPPFDCCLERAFSQRARETGRPAERHSGDFRDGALSGLALLAVKVDVEADRRAWNDTLHLAERHRLTVYDAAYLEIASRRKIPIATLDRDLRSAATNDGVQLLGE